MVKNPKSKKKNLENRIDKNITAKKEIPFFEAKEIIDKEIEKYKKATGDSKLPGIESTAKKEHNRISIPIERKSDYLKIFSEITTNLGGEKISGCYLNLEIKSKDGLCITLGDYFIYRNITFTKKSNFNSEELQTIINIYIIGNPPDKKKSPRNKLSELGAIVYNPKNKQGWEQIAGYEYVKEEIMKLLILPFKHKSTYEAIKRQTRKAVSTKSNSMLFNGPPGTGKTSTARAIAKEVNIPVVYVPIESIMSKYYGESEKKLSKIFKECRKLKAIVFIDEIEALARYRDNSTHEATNRIQSVILRETEGFEKESMILIGATNKKEMLDPALLSRFGNKIINFRLPNYNERKEIFKHYAKHLPDKDLNKLSKGSEKFSGRTIENVCECAEMGWLDQMINKQEKGYIPPIKEYLSAIKYMRLNNETT